MMHKIKPRIIKQIILLVLLVSTTVGIFIVHQHTISMNDEKADSSIHAKSKAQTVPEQIIFPKSTDAIHSIMKDFTDQDPNRFWKITTMLTRKYPDTFFIRGSSEKRIISLSFDDGPDNRYTPQILDILDQYHIKATFFLLGVQIEKAPEMLLKIHEKGHEIGNHGWSHKRYDQMSIEAVKQDIQKNEDMIVKILHIKTNLLRPPYGLMTEEQVLYSKSKGYKIIDWSVDSTDSEEMITDRIYKSVVSTTQNGSIILMHCAGGNRQPKKTVSVLPDIIIHLQNQGYRFVTVSGLLAENP